MIVLVIIGWLIGLASLGGLIFVLWSSPVAFIAQALAIPLIIVVAGAFWTLVDELSSWRDRQGS